MASFHVISCPGFHHKIYQALPKLIRSQTASLILESLGTRLGLSSGSGHIHPDTYSVLTTLSDRTSPQPWTLHCTWYISNDPYLFSWSVAVTESMNSRSMVMRAFLGSTSWASRLFTFCSGMARTRRMISTHSLGGGGGNAREEGGRGRGEEGRGEEGGKRERENFMKFHILKI